MPVQISPRTFLFNSCEDNVLVLYALTRPRGGLVEREVSLIFGKYK